MRNSPRQLRGTPRPSKRLYDSAFCLEVLQIIGLPTTPKGECEIDDIARQSDNYFHNDEVAVIFYAIGKGMRLRVPFDGGPSELIEGMAKFGLCRQSLCVDASIIDAALATGALRTIPAKGEGVIIGGEESGYDCTAADWYCLIK